MAFKPITKVKQSNIHQVRDAGLHIDPICGIFLLANVPYVHIAIVAVSSNDSLVFGPALDAVDLPWVHYDLVDVDPLVWVFELPPSSSCGHGPPGSRLLEVLWSKFVALSRDVDRAAHQKAT